MKIQIYRFDMIHPITSNLLNNLLPNFDLPETLVKCITAYLEALVKLPTRFNGQIENYD
jgi:hypothetical protein